VRSEKKMECEREKRKSEGWERDKERMWRREENKICNNLIKKKKDFCSKKWREFKYDTILLV